jgi:cobalt/nickel transport system ATP-binding protein
VVTPASDVRVEGLAYRYPGSAQPALRDVTLQVGAGERLAVLGPNGSGKTTLMLHLNGLLETQHGAVHIGATPVIAANLRDVRRRVGLVFQDPDDQLFMPRVRDDVAFGPANLGVTGAERDERVATGLAAVGAAALAERAPHHLSVGEKRRVAIATVLVMHPEVLVLDEPTAGLDPAGRRELAELLATLTQTLIIVTHDLPFALATCPRAVILDHGTVVADDATETLLADSGLLAAHRLELPFGYGG